MFISTLIGLSTVLGIAFTWWARRLSLEWKSAPRAQGRARALRLWQLRQMTVQAYGAQLVLLCVMISYWAPWGGQTVLGQSAFLWIAISWLQSGVQSKLEKELRDPAQAAGASVRKSFFGIVALVAVSVSSLGICMGLLGLWTAGISSLGVSTLSRDLGAWVGGVLILGSVALGLYRVSPLILRWVLGAERCTGNRNYMQLTEEVHRCFASADLACPDLFFWTPTRVDAQNVMIVGSAHWRSGPKAALFISHGIGTQLSPRELSAVIMHEVAHLKLGHSRKKVLNSLGVRLVASTLALVSLALGYTFLPPVTYVAGVVLGAIAWATVEIRIGRKLVRRSEIEADFTAVFNLGANPGALISGIRKINRMNNQLMGRPDPFSFLSIQNAHPTVRERARLLRRERDELARVSLVA